MSDSTMPLTNETLRTVADGSDDKTSAIETEEQIFNDFKTSKKFGSSASVAVVEASESSSSIPSTDSSDYSSKRRRRMRRYQRREVASRTNTNTPTG